MREDIYHRAVSKFGHHSQALQAIEECSELIQAVNQFFFRKKIDMDAIASEIADVEIMCGQLRVMIGSDRVDKEKACKLEKLAGMVG